jgi:uncharacterized protein (TIGR02001 family)
MMRASAAAAVLAVFAGAAAAGGSVKDDGGDPPKRDLQLSANFALTSDYIFRGFSQSKERPALQAGVDATYKWFYAGVWGSLIDFGKDGNFPLLDVAHQEIDIYAGIKPVLGPVTLDLGVIYYAYPNARDGGAFANRELDYVELKAGASGEIIKNWTVGVTVFYSPEYTNRTGNVVTIEGSSSYVFPAIGKVTPTYSSLIGYQSGDTLRYRTLIGNGSDDYLYWNSGLTLGFGDNFSLDFRYWDTDIKTNNAAGGFSDGFCDARLFGCDERFVATAKVTY